MLGRCKPFDGLIRLPGTDPHLYSLSHHPELHIDGDVWYSCNVVAALMLYGLAVFFFIFDILPYWNKLHRQMQGLDEILGCEHLHLLLHPDVELSFIDWALTFPNVGWILATRSLGDVFNFGALHTIHLIMTIVICFTWATLVVLTALAFWRGLILKSSPDDVIKDSRFSFLVFRAPRGMEDVEKNISSGSATPATNKEAGLRGHTLPTPQSLYLLGGSRTSSYLP